MRKKIKKIILGIVKRDMRAHASSVAFFFFMALIPLLILLSSIVPLFGISAGDVNRFFQEFLPRDTGKLVGEIIQEAFDHSGLAFSISAVALLWTASRGIAALTDGLNAMYDEKESRKFATRTLLSFVYTFSLMAFICAAIYLIFSGRMIQFLRSVFPQISRKTGATTFLEFTVLLFVGCLFFCCVYKFLPSGKRPIFRQFPGAFLASAGWVLFSMAFRVYLGAFNSFTRLYGSLATVIILLFWFYWTFSILLVGGYVNAHIGTIIPGRFLRFYYGNKQLGLAVTALFLFGFVAYLSDCYMNWRIYVSSSVRVILMLLRTAGMCAWMTATVISMRQMGRSFPRKPLIVLTGLMTGSFVFIRRSVIPDLVVYLIVFSLWNAAILLMCMWVMFRED